MPFVLACNNKVIRVFVRTLLIALDRWQLRNHLSERTLSERTRLSLIANWEAIDNDYCFIGWIYHHQPGNADVSGGLPHATLGVA